MSFTWREIFALQTDVSPLQTCVSLNLQIKVSNKQIVFESMHAYRILLPRETDNSRFNSREKHMLTDSVRPFSHIINRLLTSLVRSVLSDLCFLHGPRSFVARSILKNLGLHFGQICSKSESRLPSTSDPLQQVILRSGNGSNYHNSLKLLPVEGRTSTASTSASIRNTKAFNIKPVQYASRLIFCVEMATNGHSGYPLKWFKDQNAARHAYECAICLEVLCDPVQVRDCGHQFCALCIDDILK